MTGGSVRRVVGIVMWPALLGLVIGLALFLLSSIYMPDGRRLLGPLCVTEVRGPGFNLWTGEPQGVSALIACDPRMPNPGQQGWVEWDAPADLAWRRAIPLPIGWAASSAVLAVVAWRRRDTA